MTVYKESIALQSKGGEPTFLNITEEVKAAIAKSGVQNGICTVISPHTTCAVFFEEFVHDVDEKGTEFLQLDLNDVLKKIIPDNVAEGQYRYQARSITRQWPPGRMRRHTFPAATARPS